jgi:TRAP-type mannitol/chloroaromatic compound transport system substrate-binding protein
MPDPSRSLAHQRQRGASNTAILGLVATALIVGFFGSLALRAPGQSAKAAGSGELALQRLNWKMPVSFAVTLPALGDTPLYVAEVAKASSGGQTVLTVYEPGKLVPPNAITDAVKDKKVEAGYTWLGYDQGKIPSAPLFSAVPFGMEPWEYTAWWYEGGGKALAEKVYAAHNTVPILCGITGPEGAGWFRNEIKSLKDLEGLKIRFAGLGGKVMQSLGASVTVLPAGEIFGALEKNAIDATEFSMPAIDEKLGFYKVAKNNYFPGWHQPFTAFHVVVHKDTWTALPKGSQASIETACTAGVLRSLSKGEAIQGAALKLFKANGVKTTSLPEPVLRELQKANDNVLAEEARRDALFKEVWESQKQFTATYQPWKQLGYLPRGW